MTICGATQSFGGDAQDGWTFIAVLIVAATGPGRLLVTAGAVTSRSSVAL